MLLFSRLQANRQVGWCGQCLCLPWVGLQTRVTRYSNQFVCGVPTFTSVGPGFAEDTVFEGITGAVGLVGGWSVVAGVFKNSGTAGDTVVNWWKRQKGNKSVKSMTIKIEKKNTRIIREWPHVTTILLQKKQKESKPLRWRPSGGITCLTSVRPIT